MGKRRDRRQQQASNRRVKLDLSMDDELPPSETPGSHNDLDSALDEEVKAGAKNQETANENPLSLLGQYSDDEADEKDDNDAQSLHDVDNDAKTDSLKYEDEEKDVAQNQVFGNLSSEEKENISASTIESNQQISKDLSISDTRVEEAAAVNEWQPVLDDKSGEYYYWNVRTGETTWVKPLENGSADEPGSIEIQPGSFDPSSSISPKHSPVSMETKVDCGESINALPPSKICSVQDAEKGITSLESTETELKKSVLCKNDLVAGDASTATEKLEESRDPESTVGSVVILQGRAEHDAEYSKEEQIEEKILPEMNDDGNVENSCDVQGVLENNSQQIETEIGSGSSPITMEGTQSCEVTTGDTQDMFGCMAKLMPSEETPTFEEKMAKLVERAESLHHQLKVLASHENRVSCTGISRCAVMASQTEARLTDWKAFYALGFVPEACLSFIQKELTQLELVLAAEEANELERQKMIGSTSIMEASCKVRPEAKDSDWSLNWAYYQNNISAVPEPWNHGQTTDDFEEGEIQTSYAEIYPAYDGVPVGTTAVNTQKVSSDTGTDDVEMDVDMEVDDEAETEPAVPGMSSDVPAHDVHVPYCYPYPLPGSHDMSALAPLDSTCVGEPTPYFHTGISGDPWAPPLPPDDEWAPPPPGESEPVPPPPPDEPPPLPPQSPEVTDTSSLPPMSSDVQLQYFVPDYTLENSSLPQCVSVADYQSVVDSSAYGSYVEGFVYPSFAQSTESLKIEQPYVIASASAPAFNGWTAPVMEPTASSSISLLPSETPVKPVSSLASAPTAITTTADINATGASLETKKLGKGKVKKRTHAVAAAPMLNKKVSNLVNKWKQAKEELHGGEDEDEDKAAFDVEVLEKKRQKEIEEWRRQQIASGEALDNANFQPLGTLDWRERVKRARKADAKEGKEGTTVSVASLSTVESQNIDALKSKKPNLVELSKGLPAGWQAYWDEVSAEVYYGNLSTQETTWDRPVT